MSILSDIQDKRHFAVPAEQAFVFTNGEQLLTLDDLSEAINLISPETFQAHVNGEKNDFANWVQYVFGEEELAESLRKYPTPLRMMVSIEKFLRQSETPVKSEAPAAEKAQ